MFTVKELARILEGELIGSGDVVVSGLYTLEAAGEDQVAFLESPKEIAKLEKSRAAAFIVPEGVESQRTLIKVKNPRLAWAKAMEIFNHRPKPEGIHETAVIGQNVVLGEGIALGPYVVIGDNVTIGSGT
ncbi:MAG: LpxD N-terminal domain-containing protein, partial [bacterium]